MASIVAGGVAVGAQTGSARRQGVPESTIAAIRDKHSNGVPPEDAQIIDFTRALIHKHRVDQALFDRLNQRHGTRWLVELTTTVGHFGLISGINNAFDVPPSPTGDSLPV